MENNKLYWILWKSITLAYQYMNDNLQTNFKLVFSKIADFQQKVSIIYSCIGIRYRKLFEAAKIHVQIMRFTCCLNMAFNLTKPIWTLICLHDVTQKSVAAFTYCLVMLLFVKTLRTSMMLWRRYDTQTFDAILFREIQCKKSDILCLSDVFSAV